MNNSKSFNITRIILIIIFTLFIVCFLSETFSSFIVLSIVVATFIFAECAKNRVHYLCLMMNQVPFLFIVLKFLKNSNKIPSKGFMEIIYFLFFISLFIFMIYKINKVSKYIFDSFTSMKISGKMSKAIFVYKEKNNQENIYFVNLDNEIFYYFNDGIYLYKINREEIEQINFYKFKETTELIINYNVKNNLYYRNNFNSESENKAKILLHKCLDEELKNLNVKKEFIIENSKKEILPEKIEQNVITEQSIAVEENDKNKIVNPITKPKRFNAKRAIPVIFFDVETNGLKIENSVLSIAALKVLVDFESKKIKIIDKYKRFYYSFEPYDSIAISINGLSKEVISKKRGKNCSYPEYFKDDKESFFNFANGVEHFVAHNIEFDRKFLGKDLPRQFCTMKSNMQILRLPISKRKRKTKVNDELNKEYKWPKLIETAEYYNVNLEPDKFHDSMYDVEITVKVFEKMLHARIPEHFNHEVPACLIKNFLYKKGYHYVDFDNSKNFINELVPGIYACIMFADQFPYK